MSKKVTSSPKFPPLTPPSSALLKVENLTVSWEGDPVFEDVSFAVEKGERVCIFGKSGVGKTTLFHAIAGLSTLDKGRVLLADDAFLDIRGQAGFIAYMFQNDLLIEELTVEMNCALPLLFSRGAQDKKHPSKLSKKDALECVRQLLPSFGLKEVGGAYPRELSGGMRQRAALLRTSLTGDRVVLMDEPFSALDTFTKQDMIDFFIEKAASADLTTLFISHNIEEAKAFGTRALIFAGDPQAGKPTHLIADVEPPRIEDFLGQLDI